MVAFRVKRSEYENNPLTLLFFLIDITCVV